MPDPRLARAAAAKHDAQERQLAALKVKEESAAKRRELEAIRREAQEKRAQAGARARLAAIVCAVMVFMTHLLRGC